MAGPTLSLHGTIAELGAGEWDALLAHEPAAASPFVRHAFLSALEESGSASRRTGWSPRHLAVRRSGTLVAAAPAWVRNGSDGDFSRDWDIAAAAARAGVGYYPKLLLGVPFSPVTGRRVLVAAGEDRDALAAAVLERALAVVREEGLGALEVIFPRADEARALEALGLAVRVDFQYHWRNEGYRTPDDFLARFASKRRNAIRRERAAPGRQGIAIRTVRGEELARDPAAWARDVFALHRASTDRMAWGMRWVNRRFYERVFAAMPEAAEVVEARREGSLVAMAFNLASRERLYGRYWGAVEDHPFLHFNVALYHSIDECIRRGVQVFEGGAGGEHKLARGFEPAETFTAFRLADRRLDAAVRRHLAEERGAREEAVRRWREDHPRLGG
ncbi:MAG TPA: GNAT family N-acetyltransferase [Anaeromyxobacter sp.]|nr:GNAT family N-acetyltransferase [Anaeromyxobacter sp.]